MSRVPLTAVFVALALSPPAFSEPVSRLRLLSALSPSEVEAMRPTHASVFHDPVGGSLTLTFDRTRDDAEVRVPVRDLGWPTDWSEFRAIQYVFHTTSLETLAIGFSNGDETKLFVTEPLPGIRIKGVIPFDAFVQTEAMTPLVPIGYKVWPQRLFTFERVEDVVFRMRAPAVPAQLTLYEFSLVRDVPEDDILDRRPLIDRYGQWIPEGWDGKAWDDEQLRELWSRDRTTEPEYPFCPLGGLASTHLEPTGFFRTARLKNRWVLVDPDGHPFYSAGMDLVNPRAGSFATRITRREFLFEELPAPGPAWLSEQDVSFYVANLMRRHGDGWREKWSTHIVERLRSWGFNTIANWCDRDLAVSSGMAYVLPLAGWTTERRFPFPYDFPDVFSDEFEANVDAAARRQCAPLKDDPNLIGWFLGNEPHWARSFGALESWADTLLSDPEPSATRQKLEELLEAHPEDAQPIKDDFLFTCARKYLETVTEAVRRHDPNHLVLGIRFAERPGRRWAELSRLFDVFSINIYSEDFAPDPEQVSEWAAISGRPVMIGEFTAAAPGRGLQGLFYFVHKVRDQAERGGAYRYYVENAAAHPDIVGSHWFQLVDDLPTGRPSDEERLNYGFLNVIDIPYPGLVEAAQKTHQRLYDLKLGQAEPFSEKPRVN